MSFHKISLMLHRAYLPGQRLASSRRQITRYALVSMLITFTSISHRVAKKYKTFHTLVEAGLLTEKEKQKLEDLKTLTEYKYPVNWYPIQWAQSVLQRCYSQGYISSDLLYDKLNQEKSGALSLVGIVESFIKLKYFHDVATPALLCHKERWLPCNKRSSNSSDQTST